MRKLVSLVLTLCLLVTPLLCGCESPFAYSPEEWFAENPIPSLAEPETNPIGLEIGEDYELPVLSITCDTDYYDVQKGHAVTAKIEISGDARFSGMQYRGEADIKLRGNSTAYQVKRPFKIKLAKKTNLFGMGANKHWVLLANFYDRTHLRNVLSYEMSGDLGMWYCESVWVRLSFNGEDYGLYQLCEQIRVGPERVNIFDWNKAAAEAANALADGVGLSERERETIIRQMQYDLTWAATGKHSMYNVADYYPLPDTHGGFLIENDSYNDEPSRFTTKNGVMYMVTEPNTLVESREIFRWLKKYFQNTEDAIFAADRRDESGTHYTEYIDMESFCDFWYVNEMFKNGEMLYKSTFLTLDHDSPIAFGPVWDMDWAGGNHVNLDEGGQSPEGWVHGGGDRQVWSRSLFTDPYFVLLLYENFDDTVRASMQNVSTRLERYVSAIAPTAREDQALWGWEWSFDDEIAVFREWVHERRKWMTAQFATPETLLTSLGMYKSSRHMELGAVSLRDGVCTMEVKTDGSFAALRVYVNGDAAGDFPLYGSEKDAVPLTVTGSWRENGGYNAVEVQGLDADGNVVIRNKRGGVDGCDIYETVCAFVRSENR